MNDFAVFFASIEFAAVFWFCIDRLGRLFTENDGGGSWSAVRRAAIDAVFDTLLCVFQSVSTLVSLLVANLAVIFLAGILVVVSSVIVTNGPDLIVSLDSFYEYMYFPVVKPALELMNVARMVYDAAIGIWNVMALALGSPLIAAVKTVATCDGGRPFFHDVAEMGTGLELFVTECAATISSLNASRPFNGTFSASFLNVAVSVIDRVECACAIDRGLISTPVRVMLQSQVCILRFLG